MSNKPDDTINDVSNKIASIDRLFRDIQQYRSSEEFRKMIEFYIRFPYIGAFNAALVQQQRPGATFVLSASCWNKKYNRQIKLDARPVVILIPFGPVEFLYDISDTVAIPFTWQTPDDMIIDEISNQFRAKTLKDVKKYLEVLENNLSVYGISLNKGLQTGSEQAAKIQVDRQTLIQFNKLGILHHGYFNIAIKANANPASAIAHMSHELGHLFCRHLRAPSDDWWKERDKLPENVEEFEAETVSYLVCQRIGIETASAKYLTTYLAHNSNIPTISIERVLSAVDVIEHMLKGNIDVKKGMLYKKDKEFKRKVDVARNNSR